MEPKFQNAFCAPFVEKIGAQLDVEPFHEQPLIEYASFGEEFHICSISWAISRKLGEDDIMSFEGFEPQALKSLGGNVDQSSLIAFRVLSNRNPVERQLVFLSQLGTLSCNLEESIGGGNWPGFDEVNIPCGAGKVKQDP